MGLAHQVILPDVAEPEGLELDGDVEVLELEPQALRTIVEAAIASVAVLVRFVLIELLLAFPSFFERI
ncbi:MAG: hypothetical protein ACYDHP_08305 [Ferrimicrobium sp.]